MSAIDDLPPLAELKAMADLNLQLPLPQLDAADGSGVFVRDPESPAMLDDLADDALAGDDDGDSPTQQASGEAAPGLVAAPPFGCTSKWRWGSIPSASPESPT